MQLPPIVSEPDWQQAHEELLTKEKAATRAADALAAERRRQPMMRFATDYRFEGPEGTVDLLGLFQGRRQLVVYHFWFPPGGPPCSGCSMFTDQLGHVAHVNARDTTFVLASRAPQAEIEAYKRRMGWEEIPWYTDDERFQVACGTTEYQALHVFVRDDEGGVYLTYLTRSRGVEAVNSVWTVLDRTPLGRQEEWEDTPRGRPQTPAYQWWRLHDEYEASR
jgi:predicted dithiol-disulfide oxidoreductase (DUF899 family)